MANTLNSKSLILCLIGLKGDTLDGRLGGITRLQKLIFLLDREYNVQANGVDEPLKFVPYKAGPYSPQIYDDLEYLENLGYITGEPVGSSTREETSEVDALNFNNLFDTSQGAAVSSPHLQKIFSLTSKGKEKTAQLIRNIKNKAFLESIQKIKSKYGDYFLNDLLHYVYTKYPAMTTESEIKAKILNLRPLL